MKAKPILIKAGDKTILINGHPPKVDIRVVAEDYYQKMNKKLPKAIELLEALGIILIWNKENIEFHNINDNALKDLHKILKKHQS